MESDLQIFGNWTEYINYVEREGVYGIHFDDDLKVAVIKVGDDYFLPGGGIEQEESKIECLKREFIEETGMHIEVIEFVRKMIQYHLSKNTGEYYKLIGNFYLVRMQKKIADVIEPDHELVWIHIDNARETMLLEYQAEAIIDAHNILIRQERQLEKPSVII